MGRHVENADGMFPVEKIPLRKMTPEDWAQAQRNIDEHFDLDACLDRMIRAIAPLVGDPAKNPLCTSDAQDMARRLALMIDALPAYLASGDTRGAALEGINIGVLAQRLDLLPFEPDVTRGRHSVAGAAVGRAGKATKTQALYQKMRDRYAQLRREEEKRPKSERATIKETEELLAYEFRDGLNRPKSVRTVQRALGKIHRKK